MIKLNLRCAAKYNQFNVAYGYGRTYHSFVKYLSRRDDVQLVEDYREADMQVCMCYPHKYVEEFAWWGRKRHPIQVIYTTWEVTILPKDWTEVINRAQACFVPSQWAIETFRDNGVQVPIHWTPNAADGDDFKFCERDWAGTEAEWWDGKKFVYIWQGMHPADRKNMVLAQRAFQELDLPDSWFIAKWYPIVSSPVGPVKYDSRRITQIGRIFNREAYQRLLGLCHVSVNPFRGESPGQMPMETASTGMFTIATNWGGATDYLHEDYFWPLKYRLCEPGQDYISTSPYNDVRAAVPGRGQDALADFDDLKRAMRWAYENREEAAKIGAAASRYIQQEWNWEMAAAHMVNACKKVLANV